MYYSDTIHERIYSIYSSYTYLQNIFCLYARYQPLNQCSFFGALSMSININSFPFPFYNVLVCIHLFAEPFVVKIVVIFRLACTHTCNMAWYLTMLTMIYFNLILSQGTSSNTDCVDGLSQWVTSNGGSISNSIEIRSSSNLKTPTHSVYTTSSTLLSNDVVLSIPISLLFTMLDAEKLLKSILPQNKQDAFSNLGDIDTLSLALLIEHQNTDSFWSPYLQCLPSIHHLKHDLSMPLWWSPEEIRKYFQTSAVSIYITQRLKSVHDSFKEINSTLHSISYLRDMIEFTLDHWIWALSIVWSRQFTVHLNDEHPKVKCLVPFGDFFNFNTELNTINIDPATWNQSQFARSLLKYDVIPSTTSDDEHFVFKIMNDIHRKYDAGMELYAEYVPEVLPNFVIFMDYGFCVKDNPMDGMWITVEQLLNSLKFKEQFKTQKIKPKAQQMMKNIIETLQLSHTFVVRSVLSEYYMDIAQIPLEHQKQFIEPYGYSLFLMSLVLNAKNKILSFGNDLMSFKFTHPEVKTNKEILAVILGMVKHKFKSKKKTVKLIKNTWNTINNFVKSEMKNYDTSLIQDLMMREQLEANSMEMDDKLDCALYIRSNEKHILLSVWIQLQRLRELLLHMIKVN
eukprot:546450_1